MNGFEAKAKLIMTAIESIQYVSSGRVFIGEYAKSYNISQDVAESKLAGICTELTDPLWEQWREVKHANKEKVTN